MERDFLRNFQDRLKDLSLSINTYWIFEHQEIETLAMFC